MNQRADFPQRLAQYRARIEQVLERCLELPDPGTQRLREAMRYSALGGGKRLRPVLVYLTGESLGASLAQLDAPRDSPVRYTSTGRNRLPPPSAL